MIPITTRIITSAIHSITMREYCSVTASIAEDSVVWLIANCFEWVPTWNNGISHGRFLFSDCSIFAHRFTLQFLYKFYFVIYADESRSSWTKFSVQLFRLWFMNLIRFSLQPQLSFGLNCWIPESVIE